MKCVQVFSLIGCSYQLISLFVNFFRFDVISVIEFTFPEEIIVPDVTLCTELVHSVNYETFYLNHSSLIPSNCSHVNNSNQLRHCIQSNFGTVRFASWIGENFNVKTFYSKLAIKPEQLFTNISFARKSLSQSNVLKEGICTITPYIRDPLLCYTINCKNRTNHLILNQNDLKAAPNLGAIYLLLINQSFFNQWNKTLIYFTQPGILPRGFEFSQKLLDSKPFEPILFFVSYLRIYVKLRPFPYQSNCLNYSKLYGVSHRNERFENCLNDETSKKFESITYSTFIDVQSNLSFSNHLRSKLTFKQEFTKIEAECATRIIHPECVSNYLIPINVGRELFNRKSNYSGFVIMAPSYPDLRKKTKPRTSYEDLFISSGSILSFWLGFNVLHHVGQFLSTEKSSGKIENNMNKSKFRAKIERRKKLSGKWINHRLDQQCNLKDQEQFRALRSSIP